MSLHGEFIASSEYGRLVLKDDEAKQAYSDEDLRSKYVDFALLENDPELTPRQRGVAHKIAERALFELAMRGTLHIDSQMKVS